MHLFNSTTTWLPFTLIYRRKIVAKYFGVLKIVMSGAGSIVEPANIN